MKFDHAERITFPATLDCQYLLHVPHQVTEETLLAVALHGFSSNPEVMLKLTGGLLGADHAIASLQGPSHFHTNGDPGAPIGYSWATNRHSVSSIRLHHNMVHYVLREAGERLAIPRERRLLVGFSRPVGLNYRFAATHADAVRGVIGICGGLPKVWETAPEFGPVRASLLHIARREDEYYPPQVTELYPARMRTRAADVEFHLLDGGHRFPSKGREVVEPWLARVFAPGR
jgi:predicted esterase